MGARSTRKYKAGAKRSTIAGQLLFRYRDRDTVAGVSRNTVSRLAKTLGLTETQTIHLALARLAQKTLPRYEPDDAPLTGHRLAAIKRLAPRGRLVVGEELFS